MNGDEQPWYRNSLVMRFVGVVVVSGLLVTFAACNRSAQTGQDQSDQDNLAETLLVNDWWPETAHQVPRSDVSQAAYGAIDVHSHVYTENAQEVDKVVKMMDQVGVDKRIVLTGTNGDEFESLKERYARYPDRFELWCDLDFSGHSEDGWVEETVAALERCAEMGAGGIGEVHDKGKGLSPTLDPEAQMHPNDPRMDPIVEKLAELEMPINIHIAEPIWMYLPMDSTNDGLMRAHTWHVEDQDVTVSHSDMIDIMAETLERHPNTTFIACHLMNLNNNLDRLGGLLDEYPNLYLDIGARFAEFGTIPRHAADFFTEYQDRILYGTDYGFEVFGQVDDVNGDHSTLAEMYRMTFRVLETADDHFYMHDLLGYRWPLYGLDLSDQVLEKIYRTNARRLLDL